MNSPMPCCCHLLWMLLINRHMQHMELLLLRLRTTWQGVNATFFFRPNGRRGTALHRSVLQQYTVTCLAESIDFLFINTASLSTAKAKINDTHKKLFFFYLKFRTKHAHSPTTEDHKCSNAQQSKTPCLILKIPFAKVRGNRVEQRSQPPMFWGPLLDWRK